jgi:hypothetical protein
VGACWWLNKLNVFDINIGSRNIFIYGWIERKDSWPVQKSIWQEKKIGS